MMPGGTIKAEFKLDQHGKPQFTTSGGVKHYKIRIHMEDLPEDTYAVTYVLHDTYYDPVRECRDSENQFEMNLTSYGDYTIQARVRTRQSTLPIAIPLSVALSESYVEDRPESINEALNDIRNN